MDFLTWLRLHVIHKIGHPSAGCFLKIKEIIKSALSMDNPMSSAIYSKLLSTCQMHLISKANKEILVDNLHLKEKK